MASPCAMLSSGFCAGRMSLPFLPAITMPMISTWTKQAAPSWNWPVSVSLAPCRWSNVIVPMTTPPTCAWAGLATVRTRSKPTPATPSPSVPRSPPAPLMRGQKIWKPMASACHRPALAAVCGCPSPGVASRRVGRRCVYLTMRIRRASTRWVCRLGGVTHCCCCPLWRVECLHALL